jgi:hypothetical protein
MTKFIITIWVLKLRNPSQGRHMKNIKLMNHKSRCLLQMRVFQWLESITHVVYDSNRFILLWMKSPSYATTWGTPHSLSCGVPFACRTCKLLVGLARC